MNNDITLWYEQAKTDLAIAKQNANTKALYVAAFLAQQSAEKALKAVYIKQHRDIIQTHSLRMLGEKVSVPDSLIQKLKRLNPHYFLSRYPDATGDIPADSYDQETVDDALSIADEVLVWTKKQLNE